MNLPVFEMLIDTTYLCRLFVVGLLIDVESYFISDSNFGFHC